MIDLAMHINQPWLPELVRRFLFDDQLHPKRTYHEYLDFNGWVSVFHFAIAQFYALSDLYGAGKIHQEHIRSTPRWREDGI